MVPTSRPAVWVAWLPLALLVAAGCKQGPTPEVQARMDSLSQASSDRDRLMQEVAENTRLVSEISRELAKASVPAKALKITAESPLRASRDTLIQKIRYVTTRMREIEPRLKDSEQRIRQLTTLSDSLRDQLAATMQNLQGVIDNQKETIEALTNQVDQLSTQLAALKDTIETMATEANTVYYVIGTKDELEQKGIVREIGGAGLLFVPWKALKAPFPAPALRPTERTVAARGPLGEPSLSSRKQRDPILSAP